MKQRRILTILTIIMLSLSITPVVKAETLQDKYNQLSSLQQKLATANSSKRLTESQINSLRKEINTTNANISKTKSEITQAEKDIVKSQDNIAAKKEECNQLLQALQLSNDENVYLEYIFEADSYTDMIYRYAVISQMTNYNNSIMDELAALVKELEDKKVALANKEKELEKEQASLSDKLATLNANLSELTEEGTSIQDDIKSLQQDIKRYESMGCSKTEQINSCIQRKSIVPVSSGWNLPVMGATVSSQFQVVRTDCTDCGSSSHRGIDLAVTEGTKVYAAANGTVASVITSGSSLSCGGIKVYIYHNVNGILYTTVYMHLLSANVSYGQVVTPSTVIGYSGGWTTSTRSGLGYDRCTTGAHLHFGIASNNSVASFNANAFNPRNLSILANAYDGAWVSR